jgi:hypothetical protein
MVCARLKPAVSGLAQDFPGKVTARNVDASEPEALEEVKNLGFITHGLVIRSTDGKVLWKEGDHTVRVEDARDALRQILGT